MSLTPKQIPEGAIRYNTDSNKMEVWIGDKWMQVAVSSPTLDGGARAVCAGMTPNASTETKAIDTITISTTGDATDFGELTEARLGTSAYSSRTRGIFHTGLNHNEIDFITFSSKGDATDFGNSQNNRAYMKGLSNQTRGISGGGYNITTEIDFVTIASTGNAKDFGNLTQTAGGGPGGAASPTRGVFSGGYINPGTLQSLNTLQYITIASTGDSQDFGDLTVSKRAHSGQVCSATRAVVALGYNQPGNGNYDTIHSSEYYTFATKGNSTSFGDMINPSGISPGGTSDAVRGVWMGGGIVSPLTGSNRIQYVNIATEGNAIDFGDMNTAGGWCDACSSGHGGL
jgi:hypothetical protein